MSDEARRVVIHADDVGMCHGANQAFVELSRSGVISAGSVMVPCPWFAEVAAMAVADTTLDVGVHLTLNSEQVGYRWAPLTRPTPAAGLSDADGYMWASVAELRSNAHPDAVEAEWRAQLDRALAAGIDVTHVDAHMGSALAPEWCDRYIAVAADYRLPALITGSLSAYGPNGHLAGVDDADFAPFVDQARAAGMPVFDRVLETDFGRERGVPYDYQAMLSEPLTHSPADELVYCAFHPCAPGPGEIECIEPDAHHVRVDEYELFRTDEWITWLSSQPMTVIGMRGLRDELRSTVMRSNV